MSQAKGISEAPRRQEASSDELADHDPFEFDSTQPAVSSRYLVLSWGAHTPMLGAIPADILLPADTHNAETLAMLPDVAVRTPWYGWEDRAVRATSQTQWLEMYQNTLPCQQLLF